MFGDRFSSSTSCSRGVHETEPDRPDQSLTCCFLKVATHPLLLDCPGCSICLNLDPTFANNTLEMCFVLDPDEPVYWDTFVTVLNQTFRLWTIQLPPFDRTMFCIDPFPLPQIGTIGLLTVFSTLDRGIICHDFETVDTGTPPVPPSAEELKEIFGEVAP